MLTSFVIESLNIINGLKFINSTSKTLKQQENYNIETIHSPTAYTHKVREPDERRPFMSGSEGRRYLNPAINYVFVYKTQNERNHL